LVFLTLWYIKPYLLNNCVVENGEEADGTRVFATGFHQVHVVTAKQVYTFTIENPGVQLYLSSEGFSALEKKRRDMGSEGFPARPQVQQGAAD
jgi:hypothetical protein